MEAIVIKVEERNECGGGVGYRMRRDGKIPCVVYGEGKPGAMIAVSQYDYDKVIRGCGSTQLFKFESAAKTLDGQLALIKDVQVEPIKDKVLHLDFLAVSAEHRIVVEVPIEIVGDCVDVKSGEGVLNFSLREIEIEALPTAIPKSIAIDVTGMAIGDSVHARDLKLPEGSKLKSDAELSVLSITHKKEEVVAAPVAPAEGEAAAAGAAGTAGAAAGAAPAAGAAGSAPAAGEKKESKK